MESNFVLLGLIILTVACIYLFYTSFQKNREYDALAEQVNLLRTRDLSREAQMSSLYQQKQQPQHQPQHQQQPNQENLQNDDLDDQIDNKLNLEVNIDYDSNDTSGVDNNKQRHELTEEEDGEVVDLTEHNNELSEQLDIELDESELNEINNLGDLDELNDLNVTSHNQNNLDGGDSQNDINDVNDDVASLIESVLLEPSDNNMNDLDSVEELDDVNTSDNDTQYLNMSQENLDNMTLKELKLMCKNLDLKSKGNKDELIERVQEKLKQN